MTDVDSIKTIFDPSTCLKRGFAPVATSPSRAPSPHNLYYEVHGDPSPDAAKLVFVMGLNNSSFAWHNQVSYFASQPGYQILVYDNRGVGHSDAPKGLYKTSEMADDLVELLDFLGWTEKRQLHVIGVSMGGMIVQQLALAIPERIASLILTSTKCGDRRELPSKTSVVLFAKLLTGMASTPEQVVPLVMDSLFLKAFLDSPDPDNDGKPRREGVQKDFLYRIEIGKVQSVGGKLGQMAVVLGHHVSAAKLKIISETIPKVAIIVGDEDLLIDPKRSSELHEMLPGSEFKLIKGGGHALPSQIKDEYNSWIADVVQEAKTLCASEAAT